MFPTCSALVCVFVSSCVYRCGLCVRRKISENIWSAASISFNQLLNSILHPRLLYRARWLSDTLMTSSADWSAHYCQSTANRPNENVCLINNQLPWRCVRSVRTRTPPAEPGSDPAVVAVVAAQVNLRRTSLAGRTWKTHQIDHIHSKNTFIVKGGETYSFQMVKRI